MQIDIIDPIFQTNIFLAIFIAIILFTIKKDPHPHSMNHSHTNELKGIAILTVIFCHIGYFLFKDDKFLFPLSVAGGVGVNLFLFLSGFGLASSQNRSPKGILQFYIKRLKTIFVPMWIVLILILIADYFLLNRTYPTKEITNNLLGFFPVADLDTSINSPLWYFSYILFYYLTFPILYKKDRPYLSAFAIFLFGYFMIRQKLHEDIHPDVIKLYALHYAAFPLGIAFANFYASSLFLSIKEKISKLFKNRIAYYFVIYTGIALLAWIFSYYAIHSGVGEKPSTEQTLSLITAVALVGIILLKNIQSRFLILLGTYSYEIYLIHWPLMYRHDYIYKYTQPFLGTLIYLAVFILIGFGLDKLTKFLNKN